ncbi:MAG: CFI-box-CTERM domain-containing protein [Dehalococcoidia bacterium]
MKRQLSILFVLVLVVSLGLVTAVPVLAAGNVIHVPGDYPTIQAAIDAASDGDTIVVAAGSYNENVVIDKSLTLQGAQAGVDARTRSGAETIIKPSGGTGIKIITAANRVVVIDGLTVQNTEHGITTPEPTMAADITVKNVRALHCNNFSISLTFTLKTTVEYCYVEGATQAINAGALDPFPPTVATFRNNEVVNAEFGITGYLKDSLIEGNRIRDFAKGGTGISGQFYNTEIKNNTVTGYVKGAGLSFASHYGRDLSQNVTVAGNNFTGNSWGIYVFDTQTTLTRITVDFNNLDGNSKYGVWNEGGQTLDATKNWWGDASGPSGIGPGDGAATSTRVLYSPWLGAEPGTAPMTWAVDPTGLIQDAIDAADPADTIVVTDGEYQQALNIDKSLTLKSTSGYEGTTIVGSVSIGLYANTVYFGGNKTGFTIDANGGDFAIWLSGNNGSKVTISQNILTGAKAGITTQNSLLNNSTITIEYSRIYKNNYGIYLESVAGGSSVLINHNSLAGNNNYGLYVKNSTITIDATNNWWGHASGPSGGVIDPVTARIANGTGVAVSGNVHFDPWLTAYLCTLTISSTGGGAVVMPGEGTFKYDSGTVVQLIATTSSFFYQFNKWTGDVRNVVNVNAATTNVTMNDDYLITANFKGFWECFIATAAYGTPTAKEIDILREFRDTVLLPNSLGVRFVSFYYKTSPPIARFISQHELLRTVVRVGFVDPIVRILTRTHNLWSVRNP